MRCIQADFKSFLVSKTFFLGHKAAEQATKSQVINYSFWL